MLLFLKNSKSIIKKMRINIGIVLAISALVLYFSLLCKYSTSGVGGSDSFGYAVIAKGIIESNIVQPIKEMSALNLNDAYKFIFIPLAFTPGPSPATKSPAYPIGLPLIVASSVLLIGWENGPFIVGPFCAALSVLLIFLVGLELGLSRTLSIIASVIIALFPTVTYMGLTLMSDVPAMCVALTTIYFSLRSRTHPLLATLAGFSFGLSFLVRPTNIILIIPLIFCLKFSPKNLLYFFLGGTPLAAIFFIHNAIAFGNPLLTGYVSTGVQSAFAGKYFVEHLKQFSYWLSILLSPLLLPLWGLTLMNTQLSLRFRLLIISWFASFLFLYCIYDIPYNLVQDWWYTRFLLPGIPALILGCMLTIQYFIDIATKSKEQFGRSIVRYTIYGFFLLTIIGNSLAWDKNYKIFESGNIGTEHKNACIWAGKVTPGDSIIVSMITSGGMQFYADRMIVRYDYLNADTWKIVSERSREKKYPIYALLQPWEVPIAKQRIQANWHEVGNYKSYFILYKIES